MSEDKAKRGGRQLVLDPHHGGWPIPAATQDIIRQRILDHAQKHYAGKFTRIDVRFRGAMCYIDAYKEPPPDSERLAKLCRVPLEEYVESFRNTPTRLVRLRHFDLERWSLAFYTYSNERYEPCVYPDGGWFGTVEQAFDVGAVHLD